jgi:hypothetical protein
MSVNTSKFSFSWNTIAARGFADGDAVSAEFDNESSTSYSGTKGEGSTVVGVDRRATITVRLQGDSKTVAEYITLNKAMRLGEVSDTVPYIFKKIVGDNTIVWTGTATLSKEPSVISNREMPELEFIFKSSDSEMVVLRDQ